MQSEERILAGVAGVSNAIADFVQGLKHGTKKAHVKGIGCFREPENPDKLQPNFPIGLRFGLRCARTSRAGH